MSKNKTKHLEASGQYALQNSFLDREFCDINAIDSRQ